MSAQLTEDFVERRTHSLITVPKQWQMPQGQYYELDLKMCQLRHLQYAFRWGTESGPQPRVASIVDTPSRILKLDLSLNELSALEHDSLLPYINLHELNASLNRISKFIGVEVLKHLYSLNLSHNFIHQVNNLVPLSSLVVLNLSMNELEDISLMPSLINLEVLNINNNRLKSVDGVQAIPRLRELYIQRNNVTDLVPLTSCFHLQVLNAADNHISTLLNTVDILGQLRRLEVLSLHGNPIDREKTYQVEVLRSTNVMMLDNISVRPLPDKPSEASQYVATAKHAQNIITLKEAAKQAFHERIKEANFKTEENIRFLQKRIVDQQNENKEYEEKLKVDLDSCLRYLDSLSASELYRVDGHSIRDTLGTPLPKPWEQRGRDSRSPKRDKPDYSRVKDTDELLRFAYTELNKEKQAM